MLKNSYRSHKFPTSEKLIVFMKEHKAIKTLAFYYKIKSTYQNSVIYNFKENQKDVAKRLGVSRSTLNRHFNLLEHFGFMVKQPKKNGTTNLWFRSFYDIHQDLIGTVSSHKTTIYIKPKYTINDIVDLLLNKLIQEFMRQEKYAVEAKDEELRESETKLKHKKLDVSKLRKLISADVNPPDNFANTIERLNFHAPYSIINKGHNMIVGYRKLSEVLGYSVSFTWKLVKRLKQKGLIRTQELTERVGAMSYGIWLDIQQNYDMKIMKKVWGHLYYKRNSLYSCLGTAYTFTDYPIKPVLYAI